MVLVVDTPQFEFNSWMDVIKKDTGDVYRRIQLVTKDTFNYFPVDVVNRYNSHAPFFFDGNTKRVRSITFRSEEDIPQVYYLRKDIDTVYFYLDEVLTDADLNSRKDLFFKINRNRLEGDLADYLVRLSFRKGFTRVEDEIAVTISDVSSDAIQPIIERLREYRIRAGG